MVYLAEGREGVVPSVQVPLVPEEEVQEDHEGVHPSVAVAPLSAEHCTRPVVVEDCNNQDDNM